MIGQRAMPCFLRRLILLFNVGHILYRQGSEAEGRRETVERGVVQCLRLTLNATARCSELRRDVGATAAHWARLLAFAAFLPSSLKLPHTMAICRPHVEMVGNDTMLFDD